MAFSKTILLLFVLANKVVSQRDTTTFTYDSFTTRLDTQLIYQGDAFIPFSSSSSSVRLTKADPSGKPGTNSIGRLVYAPQVNFWDVGLQASFETTMKFLITRGDSPNPGDTLSFFIAPVNSPIPQGSIDGSLGLFDRATGLAPSVFAVEFDIAPNPSWDPNYAHIGININSRVSTTVSRFENAVGHEVTARINYVASTRTITVFASYGSGNSTVSYVFDLKTILPKRVQVGISATTGSWVAFFDLHAWHFSSDLVWDGTTTSTKPAFSMCDFMQCNPAPAMRTPHYL